MGYVRTLADHLMRHLVSVYLAYQMSPFEGAPEEFDQTIFAVQTNRTVGPVEAIALNFVKEQQR